MRIDIISAVPDLLESPLNHSIIKRAKEKGLVEIHIVNLHDYGRGNYKQIDDYGFGGDAGMVIKPEPLYRAITDLTSQRDYDHVIYTSPDGEEISIGSYVLSGGELAACVICDSIIRLIPGALTDETSALSDSFQDGLLAPPIYTRPADFMGWKVPDVLLSGNPKLIQQWQEEQALERTRRLRPDLLDNLQGNQ